MMLQRFVWSTLKGWRIQNFHRPSIPETGFPGLGVFYPSGKIQKFKVRVLRKNWDLRKIESNDILSPDPT